MQPAHVYGNAPAGVGTWLALYDGLNNGVEEMVDVIRINNPLTTPKFTRFSINLGDIEDTTIHIAGNSPPAWRIGHDRCGDRPHAQCGMAGQCPVRHHGDQSRDGSRRQSGDHRIGSSFDTSNSLDSEAGGPGNVGGEELGLRLTPIWPAVNVDSKGNMVIGFCGDGTESVPWRRITRSAPPATRLGPMRVAGTLAAGQDVFALGARSPPRVNALGRLHQRGVGSDGWRDVLAYNSTRCRASRPGVQRPLGHALGQFPVGRADTTSARQDP